MVQIQVPALKTIISLHAMAQNQPINFISSGGINRDMSFYDEINITLIKITIRKILDSEFTQVQKENFSEF